MSDPDLLTLHAQMKACRLCMEAGYETTPGAVFSGPGSARVMVVGQAPGVTECDTGRPFNASSGQRLFRWLAQAGWDEDDFRATQYMTAVTKCYPGKAASGKGDRAPTRAEQKLCAPYLEQELALVQPQIVIAVGSLAIKRFLGATRLVDVVGTTSQVEERRWVVPLPHPSGASLWLNRPENVALVELALDGLCHLRGELGI